MAIKNQATTLNGYGDITSVSITINENERIEVTVLSDTERKYLSSPFAIQDEISFEGEFDKADVATLAAEVKEDRSGSPTAYTITFSDGSTFAGNGWCSSLTIDASGVDGSTKVSGTITTAEEWTFTAAT